MLAVSYLLAYSFNIMRMRHPIVPVRAPPDPTRVLYSGSDDTIEQVPYIFCLNGRVPKMYDIWRLKDGGVREVHPFAQVRLFDDLREDTFKTSSSIRGDAVFPLLVGDYWTIVLSFSASSTSILTLKLSSSLLILLFTIGVPILPWSVLLFPISLDARTILLQLSVG